MTQSLGRPRPARARLGMRSAVGAPIVVGSRVWGAIVAATHGPDPLPPTTETRVTEFTELVATAIANVAARAEGGTVPRADRRRCRRRAPARRARPPRRRSAAARAHGITLNLARSALERRPTAAELVDEALDNAQRANRGAPPAGARHPARRP